MYGRSWVRFPSGTQIFSLSHARDKLNIPSFLFLSELNIYHLSFFFIKLCNILHLKKHKERHEKFVPPCTPFVKLFSQTIQPGKNMLHKKWLKYLIPMIRPRSSVLLFSLLANRSEKGSLLASCFMIKGKASSVLEIDTAHGKRKKTLLVLYII